MIPMRKFADYQRAAWGTQTSMMPSHSPQRSEAGFSLAAPGMRHSPQGLIVGGYGHSRMGSRAPTVIDCPTGPQPTFSPFNQTPGYNSMSRAASAMGSEHGGYQTPNPYRASHISYNPYVPPQNKYGMPIQSYAAPAPVSTRNSSYSMANWVAPQHAASLSMSAGNPFNDSNQGAPAAADPTNPTDAELLLALRQYLRTQDLLQITKVGYGSKKAMLC